MSKIYEIPGSVKELFTDESSYRIIDRDAGEMDNIEAMRYFIESVGISSDHILLDDGTQVHFWHPEFSYHIVIDSSGLGDFYSHDYDVTRVDFSDYLKELDKISKPISERIKVIKNMSQEEVSPEVMKELFEFIYLN